VTRDPLPIDRLKTGLRAQAWLRRCTAQGLMSTVVRKGDPEAGALFIKLNRLEGGCTVFSGATAPDGQPAWLRATGPDLVPEAEADQYLARQIKYDPDLWIIEIEDPKAEFVMDGIILDL